MHRARRNRLASHRRVSHRRVSHQRVILWPFAAAIALGALLAGVLLPLSAQADTIALAGTVQNANGTKLGGVTVTAIPYVGGGAIATTVSASSGAFAFPAIYPGSYTLSFSATPTTFAQYLGNTSLLANAETMELFPGADAEDHSYISVALSNSGTISGKVAKLPSGGLKSYTVRALSQAADGTWSTTRSTVTSNSGAYTLTGLEPGSYALETIDLTSAHPAYAPMYSGGATTVNGATTVGVVANKTSGYNFALGKAGSVSGSVQGLYGGTHTEFVPGTKVTVFRLDGYATPEESATALDTPSAVTDSTGAYSLSGLAPGQYTLEFEPPSTPSTTGNQVYGRAFLGSATDRDDPLAAQVLTISNGTVLAHQGILLAAQGQVSGTVESSADNSPLQDIRVSIDYAGRDQDLPSEHAASVITGADGAFSFGGLGPGDYDLWVGSNAYADPTDTVFEDMTWVRQVVHVSVTAGNTTVAPVSMTRKGGANHSLYPTTFPSISNDGENVDDSASIASTGVWPDSSLTSDDFSIQWTRDEKPIPGATNSVYDFKPGDMNHSISANVTASDFGYGTKTVEATGSIGLVGPGTMADPTPTPTVTGTDAVGQLLSVTPSTYPVGNVVVSYDWQYYKNSTSTWIDTGEPATPTHLVTSADFLHSSNLRVIITDARDGYVDNIVYAAPSSTTALGTLTMVTPPTIKKTSAGFTVVGGVWSPAGVNPVNGVLYQWTVDNTAGSQLNNSDAAVLPLSGTAGNYVTVRVAHNLQGYSSTYSPAIVAQLADPAVASGTTTFADPPVVDDYLYAPTPTWTPSGGTSTYQWQYKSGSKWKNASGASTGDYYITTAADLGRLYRVVITRSILGARDAVLDVQESSTVGLGSADGTTSAPVVSGTYGTGDTVSTTTGTWVQPGGVYSYQWEWSTNLEFGAHTPIPGATKSTFVIPQSLLGDSLFVEVTSKVPGHHDGERNGYISGDPSTAITADKLTPLKAAALTHSGTVYTAHGGTFTPAATDSYKWEYYNESNSTWVVAATSASVDLSTAGPLGARWGLVVTGTASGYNPTDAPLISVANGAITHTGFVDLPPASTVDQPITPVQPTWSVASPAIAYQWREETTPGSSVWKNIAGATAATFTASGKYLNQELDVVETASKAGYASEIVVSRSTNANAAAAPTPGTSANAPSISGDDNVGSTLTAHPGTWSTTGLAFSYTWHVSTNGTSWTAIPGATKATYLIPDSAIDTDYFQVIVTASKPGYDPGTGTAATTGTAGFGTINEVAAPKVTSKNGVYKISTGSWSPAPSSYSYSWYLYDSATDVYTDQADATNTYTLAPADSTKKLVALVSVQKPDYESTSQRALAHAGPKIVSSTPPVLSGTPVVGGDLTATFGTWSTPSPIVTVQWYANGVAEPSAGTNTTIHLSQPYFGKTITGKATVALYGYTTNTYTVTSTPVLSSVVLAPTAPPVISGSPLVDSTLSVSNGTWNTTGLSFTYKWYRNGRAIPAATGASYVVGPADAGQELTAGVTAAKKLYTPVEARPDTVTAEEGAAVSYVGTPVAITNTPLVGNVLTAKLGSFAEPVTVQYSWYVNNAATPGWVLVAGAYSNTYTVSATDGIVVGSEIQLRIFVERAGHLPEELDSAPVTDGVSP